MTHPLSPITPVGLDHVVIWVGDLAAGQSWYEDVLGCRIAIAYPDIAMVHLWFGGIIIGLWDASDPRAAYARPPVDGGTNVDHLGLAVGPFDLDAMRAHLAHHHVPIEKEVEQIGARGFGQSVYIRDPWGNRLELKGPTLSP